MRYSIVPAQQLFEFCASRSDRAAWDEFLERYHKTIVGAVVKIAARFGRLQRDDLDEIVQEVYAKLCFDNAAALRRFVAQEAGSEFCYLKVIAAHVASDWYRHRHAESRDPKLTVPIDDASQASDYMSSKTMEREVLLQQVNAALAGLASDRDQTIFWLHYRAGLTAQGISRCRSVGLGEKGVESVLLRLTRLVREKLQAQVRLQKGKTEGNAFG